MFDGLGMLLLQLWKEPPLYPDVIVDHGPERTRIGRATQPAVNTCAKPRSVWTAGARLCRAPLRVPGQLKARQCSGNAAEVVLASERLHMAAAGRAGNYI
jgi:hypothetical protein